MRILWKKFAFHFQPPCNTQSEVVLISHSHAARIESVLRRRHGNPTFRANFYYYISYNIYIYMCLIYIQSLAGYWNNVSRTVGSKKDQSIVGNMLLFWDGMGGPIFKQPDSYSKTNHVQLHHLNLNTKTVVLQRLSQYCAQLLVITSSAIIY